VGGELRIEQPAKGTRLIVEVRGDTHRAA